MNELEEYINKVAAVIADQSYYDQIHLLKQLILDLEDMTSGTEIECFYSHIWDILERQEIR